MISIVVPTIKGRDGWLQNSLTTFKATYNDLEFIVVRDRPTCGIAWNEGIAKATGDYIMLSADDIEPATANWWEHGMYWADQGYLPCARVLNSDGSLQTCGDWTEEMDTGTVCSFARIPFGTAEQVRKIAPILEIHYATDLWFSYRGREYAWQTVVVRGFCFYHHFASIGRLDDRMHGDMATYNALTGENR